MTISPRFQVVIPLEVRRRMQLRPGAKLIVVALKPPSAVRGVARGIAIAIHRDPDRLL